MNIVLSDSVIITVCQKIAGACFSGNPAAGSGGQRGQFEHCSGSPPKTLALGKIIQLSDPRTIALPLSAMLCGHRFFLR